MTNPAQLSELAKAFRSRSHELARNQVVAGFDGFVDEMISVVDERSGLDHWKPVKDISSFGDWIKAAAGRSSLREIIVHRADPGGCAVNLGDGLIALGIKLDCFATLGRPRHSAFDDFAGKCHQCHSWGREPGRTLAFEFGDGKLMFSAVTQLQEFNPALLDQVLQDGVYQRSCQASSLIALTDWTLYPHMTSCWAKLQQEVFSELKQGPFFFIDLVDPSSRADADIRAMAETVPGFEQNGPTVLGLNGNEANVLSRVLGMPKAPDELEAIKGQAVKLRERLGISQVVIHCLKFAACADARHVVGAYGPFCAQPKKSTGAGDRFNAGYCAGLLLGMAPEASLLLGNASSGFFVRAARSATPGELSDFIDRWAVGRQDE
jgi:hypothetical protein